MANFKIITKSKICDSLVYLIMPMSEVLKSYSLRIEFCEKTREGQHDSLLPASPGLV